MVFAEDLEAVLTQAEEADRRARPETDAWQTLLVETSNYKFSICK
jgi:hypothetical protein